jgi:outer membrane murein-binding lipoprotein Lpp
VSIEKRILNIVEEPIKIWWHEQRELRAIALDVRKLEDRVKQLEQENDAMRADLLMWGDTLRLQQRINRLESENDALRADLLLWDKAGIGFTTEDKP